MSSSVSVGFLMIEFTSFAHSLRRVEHATGQRDVVAMWPPAWKHIDCSDPRAHMWPSSGCRYGSITDSDVDGEWRDAPRDAALKLDTDLRSELVVLVAVVDVDQLAFDGPAAMASRNGFANQVRERHSRRS